MSPADPAAALLTNSTILSESARLHSSIGVTALGDRLPSSVKSLTRDEEGVQASDPVAPGHVPQSARPARSPRPLPRRATPPEISTAWSHTKRFMNPATANPTSGENSSDVLALPKHDPHASPF
jgi:hypothetical protein